jgi:hypothetical protein
LQKDKRSEYRVKYARFIMTKTGFLRMAKQPILMIIMLILGVLLLIVGVTQYGPDKNTPTSPEFTSNETLVAFVESATDYAKEHGREKALAEFSNPNGSFVNGELYIYAYDFNGVLLAHPFDHEMIGVNRLKETDAEGGLFITDLRDMALTGNGYVRYYYINPVHDRAVEEKLGYVKKVDDDWWLGSGIYTK